MMQSRRTALMTLLAALVAAPASSAAQTYPDRPVKIIVPIGPAGSYDLLGRLVADQLTKRMGQTFVVENRPGAGTVVGTKAVVASPPCRTMPGAKDGQKGDGRFLREADGGNISNPRRKLTDLALCIRMKPSLHQGLNVGRGGAFQTPFVLKVTENSADRRVDDD